MALQVIQVSPQDWQNLSVNAHRAVFGEIKPAIFDRIDYALLVVEEGKYPIGYITVRELDPECVYWQYGGSFVPHRGMRGARAYQAALKWQGERSKRAITYVENTNYPMLKLHLAHGWVVIGVRTVKGTTLVELGKEWNASEDKAFTDAP